MRGPLNVPRCPQGRPLLVQAGSSPDGRDFAARYAEAIFTAQQTLAGAQEFYADIRQRARQRRGLFRTDYPGQTLREHYGLPRPESQFTAARRAAVPAPVG